MNIYLLEQDVNDGYDTYDSCVVYAMSEDEAKDIHPGGDRFSAPRRAHDINDITGSPSAGDQIKYVLDGQVETTLEQSEDGITIASRFAQISLQSPHEHSCRGKPLRVTREGGEEESFIDLWLEILNGPDWQYAAISVEELEGEYNLEEFLEITQFNASWVDGLWVDPGDTIAAMNFPDLPDGIYILSEAEAGCEGTEIAGSKVLYEALELARTKEEDMLNPYSYPTYWKSDRWRSQGLCSLEEAALLAAGLNRRSEELHPTIVELRYSHFH